MKTAVGFISENLKKEFDSLKEGKYEDKQLYSFINRAVDDLKETPNCGTKIPKDYWPTEYVKKYKPSNLWKYDLPNAWRLIYTIASDEVIIVSIVLEWFNHDDYERRFGY
jgi:mRNA-degrading endonuclease RelE of RelBE toxin-antitoxin system